MGKFGEFSQFPTGEIPPNGEIPGPTPQSSPPVPEARASDEGPSTPRASAVRLGGGAWRMARGVLGPPIVISPLGKLQKKTRR